jgi:hypothetical protein
LLENAGHARVAVLLTGRFLIGVGGQQLPATVWCIAKAACWPSTTLPGARVADRTNDGTNLF